MKAQQVIDSDFIVIKERKQLMKKHYSRLKMIKETETKKILSKTPSHLRSKPYSQIDRKLEITRNNKALLDKLMTITNRKLLSKDAKSHTVKNLRSLNLPSRKKEAERIIHENEKIAERINKQKPLITKRKFDRDYEMSKKYKDQLSKIRLLRLQEKGRSMTPIHDNKIRSHTPTFESSQKSNTSRLTPARKPDPNPNSIKIFFDEHNRSLSLQDDSSYEEDFDLL